MSRKSKLAVAVLATCIGTGAALAAVPAGLRPASRAEIEQSFSGKATMLRYRLDGELVTRIAGGADLFCPHGRFLRGRDRFPPEPGGWRAEPGRLCFETPTFAKQCQFVFLDRQGSVYMAEDDVGARAWAVALDEVVPPACPSPP